MPQRLDLYALLVGIDTYPDTYTRPCTGATVDLQNVSEYLTGENMNVPRDHILSLHNDNATRTAIISAFREHLIDNPKIKKGDAILFYYSGHGGYLKAPTGWIIVKGAGDDPDDMIEVILPHDEGVEDPLTGIPTYAIPD